VACYPSQVAYQGGQAYLQVAHRPCLLAGALRVAALVVIYRSHLVAYKALLNG